MTCKYIGYLTLSWYRHKRRHINKIAIIPTSDQTCITSTRVLKYYTSSIDACLPSDTGLVNCLFVQQYMLSVYHWYMQGLPGFHTSIPLGSPTYCTARQDIVLFSCLGNISEILPKNEHISESSFGMSIYFDSPLSYLVGGKH
jgi:hypothetical protein